MADFCGRGLLLELELPSFRNGLPLSGVEEMIEACGNGSTFRGNREAGGVEPEGSAKAVERSNLLLAQRLGEAITKGTAQLQVGWNQG